MGAKSVAAMLAITASLTVLNLRSNMLGPEGGKALAPAIAASASLTHMDLRYNNLGKEGEAAIREAMRGKTGFELEI